MSIENRHTRIHVKAWEHRRKGRIAGVIVSRYGEHHEWVDIMLIGDQHLRMESASQDGRLRDGTVITARYDWLTEILRP